MIVDLYLDWNGDFLVTPSGSVQAAVGWDQVRQRITRRLLTPPGGRLPDGTLSPPGNVFSPGFGIGLPVLVDHPTDLEQQQTMQRYISRAVLEDTDVLSTSPPSVQFQLLDAETVRIVIGVTLLTGQPGTIALKAS